MSLQLRETALAELVPIKCTCYNGSGQKVGGDGFEGDHGVHFMDDVSLPAVPQALTE